MMYGYDQGAGYELLKSCCDTDQQICLLLTGFDDCILGYANTSDDDYFRAIYSVTQVMDCLVKDMSVDDAWEHLQFNVIGSINLSDEKSPILVYDQVYHVRRQDSSEPTPMPSRN